MPHSWIGDAVVATSAAIFAYAGEGIFAYFKITAPTTTDPDDDVDPMALQYAASATDKTLGYE